ncbi:hypothetical protein [Brevundimonas sp.]|uniref:hypothetical protein n=1 Tax=Brevundimonas sp. TaxID=1871086 RepID=UPI002FC7D2F8
MKTTLLIMAAAFCLLAAPAAAQQDPTPPMSTQSLEETRPRSDAFFQTLRAGDPAKAYRDLFAGTMMETKAAELQTLISQTQMLLDAYGTLTGWGLIRSDCVTPTMCRTAYQVDMKNGPIFVVLTLHRRAGDWFPTTVYVTDVVQPFFDLS